MTKNNYTSNSKLKKVSTLLIMLMLSIVLAFSSACGKDVSDTTKDDNYEYDKKDEIVLPIKNGDFKDLTDMSSTSSYPRTPRNWTQSFAGQSGDRAPSSSKDGASGVISVKESIFNNEKLTDIGLAGKNPGKPNAKAEDDNILMLYNKEPTAQYYKSTSLSLQANTYIKVSVSIKTIDLTAGSNGDVNGVGAFIKFTGMQDDIMLKNINTNGAWKEYTLYFEGSSYTSKDLYFYLGLGDGSDTIQREYAKGHAFFDEIKAEYLTEEAFNTAVYKNPTEIETEVKDDIKLFEDSKAEVPQVLDMHTYTGTTVLYSLKSYLNSDQLTSGDMSNLTGFDAQYAKNLLDNTTAPVDNNGKKGQATIAGLTDSKYEKITKNFPFSNKNLFIIENTIETSFNIATKTNNLLTIPANGYYKISVWVKTSNITKGTGAGIQLINYGKSYDATKKDDWSYVSFDNINTTTSDVIKTEEDRKDNENYRLENWVQYSFAVQGSSYNETKLGLKFSFGPQDINNIDNFKYTKGFATFTNLAVERLDASSYGKISASDTTKKQTLDTMTAVSIANGGFNSVTEDITKKVSLPSDWTPFVGNNYSIGGTGKLDSEMANPKNSIAGIVNANYWDAYGLTLNKDEWVSDKVSTLPNALMIYNKAPSSFGFRTAKRSFSANSYSQLSIMVKTIGNAKANIYLIDTETNKPLEIVLPKYGERKDDVTKSFAYKDIKTVGKNNSTTPEIIDFGDGWAQYNFYITTGAKAKSYRLELWNGDRLASPQATAGYSEGYVFFDDIQVISLDEKKFDNAYKAYTDFSKDYVTDIIKFAHAKDKDETKEPKAVDSYAKSEFTMFAKYNEIDRPEVVEEKDDDLESEKNDTKNVTYWLLFASSLILAVVLIGTLIILLVRKLKKRVRKHSRKLKVSNTYNSKQSRMREKAKTSDDNNDSDYEEKEDAEKEEEKIEEVEEDKEDKEETSDDEPKE